MNEHLSRMVSLSMPSSSQVVKFDTLCGERLRGTAVSSSVASYPGEIWVYYDHNFSCNFVRPLKQQNRPGAHIWLVFFNVLTIQDCIQDNED